MIPELALSLQRLTCFATFRIWPVIDPHPIDDRQQRIARLSPDQRALLIRKLGKADTGIPRIQERASLPLSFAQQRLWFIDRLEPGSALYNISLVHRLIGKLEVAALERSINELVRRHEVLRTLFRTVDGEPALVILPYCATPLPLFDMSGQPADEALQQANAEAQTPFDLAAGPLIRCRLLRLGTEEHVLVIVVHHIVFDGWSAGVMLLELSALYDAFSHGLPSPLPELPIQYADFAIWQRQWLQGEVLHRQLDYWKRQLAAVPVMQLPTDRQRPAVQSHRGARQRFGLNASLSQALERLGRQAGATPFMTLLAAFQVLLHRYSGQQDIAVGAPIAGRNRPETAGLIGFFVNTLVFRGDLSGDPAFLELLQRIKDMALDAYTHQDLPFEKLVAELAPQRNLSLHPLFQAMFMLQNAANAEAGMKLDGLTAKQVRVESHTAKFDLTLSLTGTAAGMDGMIEYSTDLFDAQTITAMILHFRTLLEGIVANPQVRLSALPLLTPAERRQLLAGWNDTAHDYPSDLCVHQLFEAQAARTPEAVALVHRQQQLSYAELNLRANRLAHHLRGLGVGPDVRVGIALDRSVELVTGILAILKAGGAYVPLDPDYPGERLEFMLADTGAPVLLTLERFRAKVPGYAGHIVCLDAPAGIDPEPKLNPENLTGAGNLAYVLYTSGSTGQPKGVAIPHRGIVRLLFGVDYVCLGAAETMLMMAPAAFDASTFELWAPLLHGGRCVLFPDPRPGLGELGRVLREQHISTLWLTSTLFNTVIDEAPEILGGVRQLLIGGEALSVPHVRRALALLPHTRIINGYGPTESTTFTCCYPIPRDLGEHIRSIPIGRPIANTRTYILDRHLNPVPVGVAGELYIGGDGLARGYLDPAGTAQERFIRTPFSEEPGARLYRTGDLARYLADGNIEFLGRIDQQVKIHGFRIEPGEIEAALLRHPVVLNAVVQAREADPGGRMLAAFIQKQPDAPLGLQELHDFLALSLPAHLIPHRMFLVNQLPLNASGKVDRNALMNTPLPRAAPQAVQQAPYNALQATLLEIWTELLAVPQIGINDNFFELGGDSFRAVVMLSRIEKLIDWSVPLAVIYNHPTVEALAQAMLEHKGRYHRSPLVEIQPGTSGPPFIFMHGDFHGGGFFCYQLARFMGAGQAVYAIQPHGLPGRPMPTTIEAMAAEYLALVRAAFPTGPYFLGGHCNGAMVAFEMARRLQDEGSEVGLLAMMDPSPVIGGIPGVARAAAGIDLDTLAPDARHSEVMRLYGEICRSYAPGYYRGKLTLILSQESLGANDATRGWRRVAAMGETHVVPGNHVSMVTLHAPALAGKLVECRNKVKWD
jgi:amino acid adenylation domain-containing protein